MDDACKLVGGIAPGRYLDELELVVPMARVTAAARQRMAYAMAEMEDLKDGKLRGKGDTAGGHHLL